MRLKKNKTATKAQNNSKQRKKNPRAVKAYLDYVKIAGILFAAFFLIVLFFSNYPKEFCNSCMQKIYKKSEKLGFRLQEIVVQGRSRTDQESLLKAIELKRGDPILGIDLDEVREKVEKLEWIKKAIVIRLLPNVICIKISERNPIAVWKNQEKFYLIDEDGAAILTKDHKVYGKLPMIVGEGAPIKTPDMIKKLKSYPLINENLQALCRIRERRWNLILQGNLAVKLSDENLSIGLENLERLISEKRITEDVKEVDLRFNDRFFMKVNAEVIEKIKNNRKGKTT